MEQADIIQAVTVQLADKLKKLAKVKIKDPVDDSHKDDQPLILVTFLGLEEVVMHNPNERIACKEDDKKGNVFEYHLPPPVMFNLSYMITPYYKAYTDTLKILGTIARLMKDNSQIPIGEYDWLENNKNPILIQPISKMSLETQMKLFDILHMDYRPSLFYQAMIGINSENKEGFRRVETRKINTLDMK